MKRAVAVIGLVLSVWQESACAAADVVVQVVTRWERDSNPLRFPDSGGSQAPQSSDVLGTDLRAAVVLPLLSDRTRLVFSTAQGERRYSRLPQLNHAPSDLNAELQWAATELIRGRVFVGNNVALFNYLDGNFTNRDLLHSRRIGHEWVLRMSPEWELPWLVEQINQRYDDPSNQRFGRDERASTVSVRHVSPTGSVASVGIKQSHNRFPNRSASDVAQLDEGYAESETFADVRWAYSVKTDFLAHIGQVQRHSALLSGLDARYPNNRLALRHDWDSLNRLEAEWTQRSYTIADPTTLYLRSSAWRVDWLHRFSEKLALGVQYGREHLDFVPTPGSSEGRFIQANRLGARASWRLSPFWRWSVDAVRVQQQRSQGQSDIGYSLLRTGLEYSWENSNGAGERTGIRGWDQP